ncbi:MAG: XdhC family protein, partial [Oleispira sp.]|nr:XdhC family protein [Oleispira sp.]
LAGLPCKVNWVDSRADEFPLEIPSNVNKIITTSPCDELEDLPNGSDILILTHNHQLDFELCLTALKRNRNPLQQLRSIGLIGSQTKALRFQKRLADRLLDKVEKKQETQITAEQIKAIRCPVGLSSIPGKLPMEVAVSIVGELIALDHTGNQVTEDFNLGASSTAKSKKSRGLAWKEIKQQLNGELDSKGQGSVLRLGKTKELKKES